MKRYANMRLLAAVALLIAAAGCKDDEGPTLGQPALLSIQDATADAEVITVESPRSRPSTSAWRPSRSAATT